VTADETRNDLATSLGANNLGHGFTASLTGVAVGTRSVCAFAINQGKGANALLGCSSVTVKSAAPIGKLDTATGGAGTIAVAGWALDPDNAKPAAYKVQVDGVGAISAQADVTRNDVAKVYPGVGATVGFSRTIQNVSPGTRTVALWTQDKPGSSWVKVSERSTTVTAKTTGSTGDSGTVFGKYDGATGGTGTVSVSGWAIDPDVYDPVHYKVHIDGVGVGTGVANANRTDVARTYPKWGADVGLARTITGVKPGTHTVTLWYQDLPSGTYRNWGTKTVTVKAAGSTPPTTTPGTGKTGPVGGSFDSAKGGKGTVAVSGWALDPDTLDPVRYKIHIDGVGAGTGTANATRTDVERAHPGWGSDVGLSRTITGVKAGTHTVTVWYQDLPGGNYVSWGTKTVTVS
jgi:hypothetical protein